MEYAGPGAPHGAWPLVAADFGTRGCHGPAYSTSVTASGQPVFQLGKTRCLELLGSTYAGVDHDRLLSELGWQLLITPAVPRGNAALLAATWRPHPSWHPYLAAA